jgi:acetate kinase
MVFGAGAELLTVNGGASSLKFALFDADTLSRVVDGRIERIGLTGSTFWTRRPGAALETHSREVPDRAAATRALLDWLKSRPSAPFLLGVGHRIVHGGERYLEPCIITDQVIGDIERLYPIDPEHLPFEIDLIQSMRQSHPDLTHVACFDTSFHKDLPLRARMFALPHRLFAAGVRRYGFHGLSYSFVLGELERIAGQTTAQGRVVVAHVGSGVSLCATLGGRSIDTTMGFSPAAGVPMATRSGDLDPGIFSYLARTEQISAERFAELVNRESGLIGLSGISSDVRDLLARSAEDARASVALELFCYEIKKRVGAFAAALGGIDSLVFTGGIGENSPEIRSRICDGLAFLGIEIDPSLNSAGAPLISKAGMAPRTWVIKTDEEHVIAKATQQLLQSRQGSSQ